MVEVVYIAADPGPRDDPEESRREDSSVTDTTQTAPPVRRASRTRELVRAALIAALLCALGPWSIPLPFSPVPLTMQTFVVVLAALVLTPPMAAASVGIYLLLGAAGVPVFAAPPHAGLGVLAGPTGGYLIGFMIGALLGAIVRDFTVARGWPRTLCDAIAALVVVATYFLLGWVQLMMVTHLAPIPAFVIGVLPYLGLDSVKAAVAVGIAAAMRRSGVVVP